MVQIGEIFFTVIGCMDGRCQEVVATFGRDKFNARYADTITEPGIVGTLANNPSSEFLGSVKKKLLISLEKHHSQGIIVDGHSECAGDPVNDDTHMKHVTKAVEVIKSLVGTKVPIIGVFIHREQAHPDTWEVKEIFKQH